VGKVLLCKLIPYGWVVAGPERVSKDPPDLLVVIHEPLRGPLIRNPFYKNELPSGYFPYYTEKA
jgi:hypothetical protein